VEGIIAGDGTLSAGAYMGIAPKAGFINVRVADDQGMATEQDVVNGLQWVYDNRATYNIRVVNLSMNAGVWQSYNTSPLDAACEILWFNGIVVVVSAGNNGTATLFPPANDPFVITVGATDDQGLTDLNQHLVASFSAYGTDEAGHVKPDLVAPGKNIIAPLPDVSSLTIAVQHPENQINSYYFRMSGTSMSAPMVSGAVALLLQSEPKLNPDQVKYRLMATANKNWTGYSAAKAGAGYLDIYAAIHGTTITQTANTGTQASDFLSTGNPPVGQAWGSAQWGSAQWGSAQWGSAQWGSAQWGSAQWGSDYWGP
jgi:serine protease AprX